MHACSSSKLPESSSAARDGASIHPRLRPCLYASVGPDPLGTSDFSCNETRVAVAAVPGYHCERAQARTCYRNAINRLWTICELFAEVKAGAIVLLHLRRLVNGQASRGSRVNRVAHCINSSSTVTLIDYRSRINFTANPSYSRTSRQVPKYCRSLLKRSSLIPLLSHFHNDRHSLIARLETCHIQLFSRRRQRPATRVMTCRRSGLLVRLANLELATPVQRTKNLPSNILWLL